MKKLVITFCGWAIYFYCLKKFVDRLTKNKKLQQESKERERVYAKMQKNFVKSQSRLIHNEKKLEKNLTVSELIRIMEENADLLDFMADNACIDGTKLQYE